MTWSCCWSKESIAPEECPYISHEEHDLLSSRRLRLLQKCVDCFRFRDDLQKIREEGSPLAEIFPYLLDEFQAQRARIHSMTGFLDSKKREIRFLHELSVVLQTSMELDEVLSVAMTAITAGKGFGLNRAFLFLAEPENHLLRGHLGVGPRNYEEAWQTWDDITRNNFNLQEMAKNLYKTRLSVEKVKFQDVLSRLTQSLDDPHNMFTRALADRKPILVEDAFHKTPAERHVAEILGVDNFLVMPLISRNRQIGVIVADNYVTHRPITPQDMQSLETFAFAVAFAIERTSLYEQLQEKVDKLTAANLKLKEQQELIVRMEKMALVGKITSGIAHSIRNPLMVIGGFARSLLKNSPQDDPNREYLESIVREARQLDDVLEEVLAYSNSLYPAMDRWDINHLVQRLFQDFRERFDKDHVVWKMNLESDLPAAFIDYKQVTFCVRNIITTALEIIPEGGTLTIATKQESPDCVILEVAAEDGAGGACVAGGALEIGPGLALCKTILEKQEISFSMINREDTGTRFTLHMPIRKKEEG